MLTPDMIMNKKFEKASFGSGYKAEEVDSFLNDVSIDLSRINDEKADAEEKLEVLADKLEEYRANEDSLRTVLIGAQKLGDSIIRDAKGKAEVIQAEAEQKAKQVMYEAEKQLKSERDELDRVRRETTEFKKRLLAMYKQHLELITAMPEIDQSSAADQSMKEKRPPESAVSEEKTDPDVEIPDFDEVSMAETKEISFPVQE